MTNGIKTKNGLYHVVIASVMQLPNCKIVKTRSRGLERSISACGRVKF
jgi:hypothetical protein